MANIQDTVARLFPEVESFRAKRLSSTFPTPNGTPWQPCSNRSLALTTSPP